MATTTLSTHTLLKDLNPPQKKAVRTIDRPLLVLAGAGSGKTSVITRKISWLVHQCGYKAHHIAAVTFTNKAAREMQQRAKILLPHGSGRGLQVSTFHQLGLRILRKELPLANRKSGFSILDDQDCGAILRDILLNDGDTAAALIDLCRSHISTWKSEGQTPSDILGLAQNTQEHRVAEVYRRYERALSSYNAVDFDDLIAIPVSILSNNSEAQMRWQRNIRYMLVDEYQDTNVSQYELIKLLVGERHGLAVVGDDDQSIYTWRGANPENLNQLAADFPDLEVIKLEQNYRSSNRILRSANQLIANNSHLFEKKLWSDKGLGDPIRVIQLPNDEIEADRVSDLVLEQKLTYGAGFKDFAVLVRSNHQSKLLELKLQAKQIPYHVVGGTAFFSRGEIKDVMGYLRVLVNPTDDAAFLRIVNVPRRKIGSNTLEALGNYANQRDCSLFTAIDEFGLAQQLAEPALSRLKKLSAWFEGIQKNIASGNAVNAIKEMLEDIDYLGWLNQNSSSSAVADRKMENVQFLLQSISKEINKAKENATTSEVRHDGDASILEEVINKLILRDLLDQQSEQEADNKIQIMTLHASKGLEFPHVVIMGFEEAILPHRNSIENDDVEEERRLAYVGITRAKKSLTLTLCKQRKQFGEMLNCKPSRFLDELPQQDLSRSGFGEKMDATENKKKGKETLRDLRALFD